MRRTLSLVPRPLISQLCCVSPPVYSSSAVLVRLCELVMLVLHSTVVNAVWKYLAVEEVLDNNLLVQYLHLTRSCSSTEETIY